MKPMVPGPLARRVVMTATVAAYALMFVPIATVLFLSFFAPVQEGEGLSFTTVWYQRLLADAVLGEGLQRSLFVAGCCSLIATFVGTTGAIALERGRFFGRSLLEALTLLPLILPELVLGIASLLWFATLRMTLGTYSIILAHVTFAVSYVVVTVRTSLRSFDPALIDAARDLGCTPAQAYWKVVMPLILPGVVGGALMAFTLSFDDFLISFFTAGVGSDTLPIRLYTMIRFGLNKEMYALSTLLVVVTAGVVLLQQKLMGDAVAKTR